MDVLDRLIGKATTTATSAASAAAEAKAAQLYEQHKPLIYAATFMAATVYLFYFLPRFTLPWRKPAVH